MADEQEIRELKESLEKLERDVQRLTAASKRVRTGWQSFLIGFLIVIVAMLIGIGVIQFFLA
ncbi:hypothetical protein L1N85_00490 [Paenibacillus alkaliterrae]|uniref:hypothetical protein n=1 Tax=Paenibacillus alkaliterrae TaxID=320909 RepID=UPI001F17BB27|nr:hypothetical protein [Paenibacillus alkaliterrae]MCF2936905.1 hypothetical protein [Paenibacillus alkaliterrae]